MNVVKVDRAKYPITHEVLETISHDAGHRAGHTFHLMPEGSDLDRLENFLAGLSKAERDIFAIGEREDMDALAMTREGGSWAHTCLEVFFEEMLPLYD